MPPKNIKFKPFRLGALPSLARIEVIRTMQLIEQIKLSTTSLKMGECVKESKPRLDHCFVYLEEDYARLRLDHYAYLVNSEHDIKKSSSVSDKKMRPWMYGIEKDDTASILDTVFVLNRFLQFFINKKLEIICEFDEMPDGTIEVILDFLKVYNWHTIGVQGKSIKEGALNSIMDLGTPKRDITINDRKFPDGFARYPNAFKFGGIKYFNAHHVNIEHLFALRDSRFISVRDHPFTESDFNSFLKYWIDCEQDMVEDLSLNCAWPIKWNKVLRGIVTLTVRIARREYERVLILAKTPRKHPIGEIGFGRGGFSFNALPASSSQSGVDFKDYEILQLLNLKEQSETSAEIQEFDRQLAEYGVTVVNKRAQVEYEKK